LQSFFFYGILPGGEFMKKLSCCILVILFFSFSSCDDFFSHSLGKPQKYDLSKMDVNAENVDKWLESARGNPELTAALLVKIKQELGSTDGPEKAKLMEAGIKLAVQSSGLGMIIINQASDAMGNPDDVNEDTLMDLLNGIRNDFNSNGGAKAAEDLSEIAGMDIEAQQEGSVPQFGDDYKEAADPDDVAEAILVLALGELGPDPVIDDWSNTTELGLDITDGYVTITDSDPSPNQVVLAAYLNMLAEGDPKFDENPLTSVIKDAFKLAR
jgi:hypothetical protein